MNTELTQFPFLWPLIKEILVGTVLLLVVLIFHGSAINHVIMRFERQTTNNLVLIWAFFLMMLGLISDALIAIIFSGSCYTTVGFAPDNLPHGWKSLAFFIAFTGLFSLAWTTSVMIGMTNIYRQAWRAKYERVRH